MTDALMDRIKAHRSAPDVYDPPTFDQMADRIEELVNGVDGLGDAFAEMAVKREAAEAKLAKAVETLREIEADCVSHWAIKYTIRAVLAELEGKE